MLIYLIGLRKQFWKSTRLDFILVTYYLPLEIYRYSKTRSYVSGTAQQALATAEVDETCSKRK